MDSINGKSPEESRIDEMDLGRILDRLAKAATVEAKRTESTFLEKPGHPCLSAHMATLIRILDERSDGADRAADILICTRLRHADLIRIASKSQETAARVVAGCPDVRDRWLELVAAGIGCVNPI